MRLLIAGLLVRVQSGVPSRPPGRRRRSRRFFSVLFHRGEALFSHSLLPCRRCPLGRPPLPLGTSGKVLFATLPNGRVRARVKFRDYDGRVRLVSKVGASRAAAERALKADLTSRQAPGGVGARIRGDQQLAGARMVGRAAGGPPAADRGDGERRGVVVDPDVDPADVGAQVIDAIRNGPRHLRAHAEEAVVLHRNRVALRPPFSPGRGQLPELLLLLASTLITGAPAAWCALT